MGTPTATRSSEEATTTAVTCAAGGSLVKGKASRDSNQNMVVIVVVIVVTVVTVVTVVIVVIVVEIETNGREQVTESGRAKIRTLIRTRASMGTKAKATSK